MLNGSRQEEVLLKLLRLERDNNRMKGVIAVVVFIALVVTVVGGAHREIPQTLEAREFQLRDEKGKILASLEPDPINGIPSLQFFDPKPGGTVRASYSMNSATFFGKVRNGVAHRIELGMHEDNQPSLSIRDDQGKYRFHCGVAPNNEPFLIMQDREERPKLSIRISENGLPSISLQDIEEKDRAILALREDGSPFLGFLRLNNHITLGIDGGNDRPAGITFIDENGKNRILIKIQPDGQAVIKMTDANGKEVQLSK